MGTAVLSPRDCLLSSHDPFSYHISEMIHSSANVSRSRSAAFQASAVSRILPSFASDHAIRSPRGASVNSGERELRNSSSGLLPVPVPSPGSLSRPRQASQKRSSSAFLNYGQLPVVVGHSSTSRTSPANYSSSASSAIRSCSSYAKVPTSRSASTGVLGRQNYESRDGKFSMKVVGNYCVINESVASRFSDVKSGPEKRYVGGSEDVSDVKKRTYLDFSRRGHHDYDAKKSSVAEEPKKVGKGRQSENSKKVSSLPVTILQRPKTEEVANELLASVLREVALPPRNAVSKSGNLFAVIDGSPSPSETLSEMSSLESGGEVVIVDDEKASTAGSGKNGVPASELDLVGDAYRPDRATVEVQVFSRETEVGKWMSTAGGERWAGPAYSNSPPPSSLPLPKFSTKLMRYAPSEIAAVELQFVGDRSDSAPCKSSAPLRSHSLRSMMPAYQPECARDVVSATANLRRILNLDSY